MPATAFRAAISHLPYSSPSTLPEDHPLYARFGTPDYTRNARQLNLARVSLTHEDWSFKVRAFRVLNNLPIQQFITGLSAEDAQVHGKIIGEEYHEFMTALHVGDWKESLDGGLDLIYTVLGALLHIGFSPSQLNAAMQEVHAANLTKLDENGQPIIDANGKVQKGPNYCPPNLVEAIDSPTTETETTDAES